MPTATPTPGSRLYLLWAEFTSLFKVGYSRSDDRLAQRVCEIEAFSPEPLHVAAVCPGTMQDERDIHAELSRYRVHGEWFSLPEPIVWMLLKRFGAKVPDAD